MKSLSLKLKMSNEKITSCYSKMLWAMQKIAKEDDYKILKSDNATKELEEFLSYYDFLQREQFGYYNKKENLVNSWFIVKDNNLAL